MKIGTSPEGLPVKYLNLEWVANYIDATELRQFQDGKESKYTDINRDKLYRFDMVDRDTKQTVYSLYLRDGQRLIFRRRTLKKVNVGDVVVFLVGYQQTFMTNMGPKNVTVINYIHPDGSISLDGPRNNLELYPHEA